MSKTIEDILKESETLIEENKHQKDRIMELTSENLDLRRAVNISQPDDHFTRNRIIFVIIIAIVIFFIVSSIVANWQNITNFFNAISTGIGKAFTYVPPQNPTK
jgi:hypothetical protein